MQQNGRQQSVGPRAEFGVVGLRDDSSTPKNSTRVKQQVEVRQLTLEKGPVSQAEKMVECVSRE